MSLPQQLYRWFCGFRRNGEEPAFVPLTAEELDVVVSDCHAPGPLVRFPVFPTPSAIASTANKLYGCDVFDSPFASEIRQRQITLPITRLEESTEVSWYKAYIEDDKEYCKIRHRLTARICSDTTQLKLTFEWDCWAAFKRKLRITKWFPVKSRTVSIEGRVLYPYLKITLPHNRHHATFRHVQ